VKEVPEDKRRSQKHPHDSKIKAVPEEPCPHGAESAVTEVAAECAAPRRRGAAEDSQAVIEEEKQAEEGGHPAGESPGEPECKTEQDLQAALENSSREKEQIQDQLLRLRADFDNFRKRVTKEKADMIQYGNEALLKDLLPVIDNVERVLSYSLKEQNWKSLQEGIELVLSDLRKTLAPWGLEAIQAVGNPFDPNLHEAIQRVENEEANPNTVLEECQKGYLHRGRLLRPSLVVVAVSSEQGRDEGHGTEGTDEASIQDKPIIN